MISPLRFFGIVIAALVVTSLGLHAGGVFINASGCELRDFGANEYLSTCSHPIFQDYEHGALFYDLEAPAGDRMRKADVLFLGSSRTQAGWHMMAARIIKTEAIQRRRPSIQHTYQRAGLQIVGNVPFGQIRKTKTGARGLQH